MWCTIGVDFPMKMFCVICILSFTSFVSSMPATTFIVPSYPPQLALFSRFDIPKSTLDKNEMPQKLSSNDEFTNWASYAMRIMAAKLNSTFFSIKDKMKKSVSNDDVKREPFQRASNFTNSSNSDQTLDTSKNNSNNSESVTKVDVVATTMATNNVLLDSLVPRSTELTNMLPTSTVATNMVSTTTVPTTTVPATNVEATKPTSATKEIPDMKSANIMSQKQIEDLDSGKSDDSKKMVHAERRQFNLPVKTFGDLFNPHSSFEDDPRNYYPFSNYLSHLFANHHFKLGENNIIVRAPDFLPSVPSRAAYIPLFLQHPNYPGYQDGQVIKTQFGGGDGGTNSKDDLAALRGPVPSMSLMSPASTTSATTSTTTTTSTTPRTTTQTPAPKTEVEDFSKPIKLSDASRESVQQSAAIRPIISVPFEAIITITRESHPSLSTPSPLITPISSMSFTSSEKATTSLPINLNQDSRNYYEIVTRDPPDDFPPFFKRNNNLTNEFGSVDVVLEDEVPKNKDQNHYKKPYNSIVKDKGVKDKKTDCDKKNSVPDESSTVNVIVENEITEVKDKNNDNFHQNRFLDDDVTFEDEDPFKKNTNTNKNDRSRKRQISAFKQLLQILGLSKRKVPKSNSTDIPLSTSPVIKVFTSNRVPGVKFEQTPPLRGRRNQTLENQESPENPDTPKNEVIPISEKPPKSDDSSQNQEFDDDENNDEEEGGSLGSITDLLPLVIPVLEDLSDPDSETDLAELLEAGIPLIQGLSEGENEDGTPINIAATISPIIQAISAGKNGQDSDSGAIITPIISLVAPLIGPILGPVIGPLLRSSSNPTSEGSSLPALIQSITGPLLTPTVEGGTSPLSNLIAEIIFELSKDLSAAGKEGFDLGGLISSVVSGALAGTSAGLSGSSSSNDKPKPDSYGAYTNNGQYGSYGQAPVPASSVNPVNLIFTTIKDILNSSINAISGLLGASSSSSSSSDDTPVYGPPPAYGPPNYKPPPVNSVSTYNNKPSSQNKPLNKVQKSTFNRT